MILLAVFLLAADAADNCKSCLNKDPYQSQCQDPGSVTACYPRMSDDKCPPGTVPCHAFACPAHSYVRNATVTPSTMADCQCEYDYHAVKNTCVQNATSAFFDNFFVTPNSTTCKCAIQSTGYECRSVQDDSCYGKTGGACPPGTEPMPDCCSACAAGSSGKDCQNPQNMACYPFTDPTNKKCAPGTFPCPKSGPPGPAPHKAPCDTKPSLCGSNTYCGVSSDPDAVWSDGSGCSCIYNFHYSKKGKDCEAGTCNGHCHADPTLPCQYLNGDVCYGKTAGACPPGTKDCDFP